MKPMSYVFAFLCLCSMDVWAGKATIDIDISITYQGEGEHALVDAITVDDVFDGQPADLSGMKVGDQVIAIDDLTVKGKPVSAFLSITDTAEVGQVMRFKVKHSDGRVETLHITTVAKD